MSAFLITWRPAGEIEGKGWPDRELKKLVRRFSDHGVATEDWPFQAFRMAKNGDRVFLTRQGYRGQALFGYGRISGDPDDKRADIEFEGLVDPSIKVFATQQELDAITTERKVWGTRHSGSLLDEGVAARLENLVRRRPIQVGLRLGDTPRRPETASPQNMEARKLLTVIKRVMC